MDRKALLTTIVNSRNYIRRFSLLTSQFLLLFFFTNLQISGQNSEPTPQPTPAALATPTPEVQNIPPVLIEPLSEQIISRPVAPEDLVHFGDVIEIDVVGTSENDWSGRIDPEGFITGLGFASEPVYALCQREDDLAQKVTAAYSKYLRNPQISVRIVDRSKRPEALMTGAIKNPQRFQIKRPVRLNELIALSGGLIDNASGEIQILRPEKLSCGETAKVLTRARSVENASPFFTVKIADLIAGQPDANPFIRSGDIVTVEEAAAIYVIGGVANPQKIFARQEMTVTRAIAGAGGLMKGADKIVTIYRRKDGATTAIDADLAKIEAKQAEDPVLQAFDIVEVPQGARDPKRATPTFANIGNSRSSGTALPLVIVD